MLTEVTRVTVNGGNKDHKSHDSGEKCWRYIVDVPTAALAWPSAGRSSARIRTRSLLVQRISLAEPGLGRPVRPTQKATRQEANAARRAEQAAWETKHAGEAYDRPSSLNWLRQAWPPSLCPPSPRRPRCPPRPPPRCGRVAGCRIPDSGRALAPLVGTGGGTQHPPTHHLAESAFRRLFTVSVRSDIHRAPTPVAALSSGRQIS